MQPILESFVGLATVVAVSWVWTKLEIQHIKHVYDEVRNKSH